MSPNKRRQNIRQSSNRPRKRRGASRRAEARGLPLVHVIRAYIVAHFQSFFYGLGRLARQPFSSVLTIAIIGMAMALPVGLHLVLKNLQGLASAWDDSAQISLFLRPALTMKAVPGLRGRIQNQLGHMRIEALSPDDALAEFGQSAGVLSAVSALGENPLPVVMVIYPPDEMARDALALEAMTATLQSFPEVDQAQLDLRWIQRLHAITSLGERVTLMLTVLFALAVLLTIGNSIRIEVEGRREEIAVEKLVGATTAFIRRPFLYTGCWFGMMGALTALGLVALASLFLQGPLLTMLKLYDAAHSLQGVDARLALAVILAGLGLGATGAWIAVGRQLHGIEP